jgi:hypothetical protein
MLSYSSRFPGSRFPRLRRPPVPVASIEFPTQPPAKTLSPSPPSGHARSEYSCDALHSVLWLSAKAKAEVKTGLNRQLEFEPWRIWCCALRRRHREPGTWDLNLGRAALRLLSEFPDDAFESLDDFRSIDVGLPELQLQIEGFRRRAILKDERPRPSWLWLCGDLAGLFARDSSRGPSSQLLDEGDHFLRCLLPNYL